MTEAELLARLETKYGPPFFAFFPQVRDATGFEGSRTLDAVAVGLYATRGYTVHGFECKVSRGDWLSEIKHPEKPDHSAALVDAFWIVTPRGLVKPGELPARWGLIETKGAGLSIEREARTRESESLDRAFAVSLLSRALGNGGRSVPKYSEKEMQEAVRKARDEEFKRGRDSVKEDAAYIEEREQKVEAVKRILGPYWELKDLESWEALRRLLDSEPAQEVERVAKHLEETAAAIRAAHPPTSPGREGGGS